MKVEQSRAPYYIKFHLGDYERDCVELSPLQDGMYFRLMRWYYSTGRPIPNDLDRVYRRLHALSVEEQMATRYILENFFMLDGPVWRQKRIEQELSQWITRSDAGKESANKRWKKNNKINGSADAMALRSHCDSNANQNQNQNHIKPKSNPIAPSQKPRLEAPASPSFISIPLNDKTEADITETMIAEWELLYPLCDIKQTLREIRGWNLANPTKRKTKSGILRHINQWLAKEQNHG